MGYYLADFTYPSWSIFVKTISTPTTRKQAEVAKTQEACQKYIEKALGILQACFAIVEVLHVFGKRKPSTTSSGHV
jgi:hypothetical protein